MLIKPLKRSTTLCVLLVLFSVIFYIQNKNNNKIESESLHRDFQSLARERAEEYRLSLREQVRSKDLSENGIIDSLEGFVQSWDERDTSYRKWYQGEFHLRLAQFYIHSGQPVKAQEHLNKIQYLEKTSYLLQYYAGQMFVFIEQGDFEKALHLIKASDNILQRMHSLDVYPEESVVMEKTKSYERVYGRDVAGKTEEEKKEFLRKKALAGYDFKHNTKIEYVNGSLCRLAALGLSIKKEFGYIDDLKSLGQCNDKNTQSSMNILAINTLMSNEHYKDGYAYILRNKEDLWGSKQKAKRWKAILDSRIIKCLQNTGSVDQETLSLFLQEKEHLLQAEAPDEWQLYFLSLIFRQISQYNDAYEIANRIEEETLRKEVLLPVYEHYFLEGDQKRTIELLESMDSFKSEPIVTRNGWRDASPDQWHRYPIREAAIFKDRPNGFTYSLAMKLENPYTRFVALRSLYKAYDADSSPEAPYDSLCNMPYRSCIMTALESIANVETDERNRDLMMYDLTSLIVDTNPEKAFSYYREIKKPEETFCNDDVCVKGINAIFIPKIFEHKNCQKYLSSLSNHVSEAVELDKAKESLNRISQNLTVCDVASGEYKEILKTMEASDIRRAYITTISKHLRKQGKAEEVVALLDLMDNSNLQEKIDVLGFDRDALKRYDRDFSDRFNAENLQRYRAVVAAINESIDDADEGVRLYKHVTGADTEGVEIFREILGALNGRAEYSNDRKLWLAIGNVLIETNLITLLDELHSLKPELKNDLKLESHNKYRLDNISDWISVYPPSTQIEKIKGGKQSQNYKKYIKPLIDDGLYREALYASIVLFDREWVEAETLFNILDKKFAKKNRTYWLSQVDNSSSYRPFNILQSDACPVFSH